MNTTILFIFIPNVARSKTLKYAEIFHADVSFQILPKEENICAHHRVILFYFLFFLSPLYHSYRENVLFSYLNQNLLDA